MDEEVSRRSFATEYVKLLNRGCHVTGGVRVQFAGRGKRDQVRSVAFL